MSSAMITLSGKLRKLKPEEAQRIAVYVLRRSEVLAAGTVQTDGTVVLHVSRSLLEKQSAFGLEVVVGPAGARDNLDQIPSLQRVPLDPERLSRDNVTLPLEQVKLTEAILKLWWEWCRWYTVSGTLIGPNGCPVPGAQVTVYNVTFAMGGGYTKTPRATVTTDANGHFTASFIWCTCLFAGAGRAGRAGGSAGRGGGNGTFST